jgi:hypothetical protein
VPVRTDFGHSLKEVVNDYTKGRKGGEGRGGEGRGGEASQCFAPNPHTTISTRKQRTKEMSSAIPNDNEPTRARTNQRQPSPHAPSAAGTGSRCA